MHVKREGWYYSNEEDPPNNLLQQARPLSLVSHPAETADCSIAVRYVPPVATSWCTAAMRNKRHATTPCSHCLAAASYACKTLLH